VTKVEAVWLFRKLKSIINSLVNMLSWNDVGHGYVYLNTLRSDASTSLFYQLIEEQQTTDTIQRENS
jgi:hypothetical protein